jgi:FkbM family methyltransferase
MHVRDNKRGSNLVTVIQKIRRELLKPLSRLCVKSTSVNYFGLNLKVPLIHGLGVGYLVPADEWMSKCLSIFLANKKGAIVDIGANIGLYLVKLKSLDSQREYYGFEPNPVCNFYTKELISANDFQKVRMFPFALSNVRELRRFYAKRKADKMGSLHDYARPGEIKSNSFDLVTFPGDEFFDLLDIENICTMKIDVEGFELEVLRGVKNTLVKYRPFVFCEIWHLPEKSDPTYGEKYRRAGEICKLMDELDYDIIGFEGKDNNLIHIKAADDFESNQGGDYVLVHKSERDKVLNAFNK